MTYDEKIEYLELSVKSVNTEAYKSLGLPEEVTKDSVMLMEEILKDMHYLKGLKGVTDNG